MAFGEGELDEVACDTVEIISRSVLMVINFVKLFRILEKSEDR